MGGGAFPQTSLRRGHAAGGNHRAGEASQSVAKRLGNRHVPASGAQPARRGSRHVSPQCPDDEEAFVSTLPLRSWLFVPGDSERKQAKAVSAGADALILDLEDSVAASQLPAARTCVREFLNAHRQSASQLWVRTHAPSSTDFEADLTAVVPGKPAGLVLPKVSSPREIAEVSAKLTQLESQAGFAPGSIRLMAIATETPAALLRLGEFAHGADARLVALTWGMEDLGAAMGVT